VTRPAYDKFPFVAVPAGEGICVAGWTAIGAHLQAAVARCGKRCVLAVECYPGVEENEVLAELQGQMRPALALAASTALRPPGEIAALVAPFLGHGDPVFGVICDLGLERFFDVGAVERARAQVARQRAGLIIVVGCGATLLVEPDLLVYADLARWEIQRRFRRGEAGNLGAENAAASPAAKYQRAFFVDWRVADRWKRPLIARAEFWLDTHDRLNPKLTDGAAVRRGLRHAVTRPFRVVPFFDPAPWGGQWLKEVCDLDRSAPNYGWGFDCVPEENSLLLDFAGQRFELPALTLVLDQPEALLGAAVHRQFGAEFPIRFDFLDTVGGGNLSFQVHPLRDYIRRHFGLSYTQDESYYLLEAKPDAVVYLGLKTDASPTAMAAALHAAQDGQRPFPADEFANRWPAHKHDHFLIPAGTVHCAGRNAVVLEISATPYIFTFKLWDWNRLGLDGKPRPIHLQHGLANIQWDRTTEWVRENLINPVAPLAQGTGWREERTGLHALQFIETRRHWFTGPVPHDTAGTVNVLNLVEGETVVVESPEGRFSPFPIHYAETFIVPAAVGPYTIRPAERPDREYATLKAFCRPG
jgi:mannose-6-phosphate isomerase class I